MPGTVLDFGHWKMGGIVVKRPDIFFGPERPAELELLLTPPPLLMQAFDCDLEALVHHMRRLSEDALRAIRDARRGRAPLGAEKVSHIHPWDEPKTMREAGGQLVPEFKMGARDFAGRRDACDAARDVTRFRVGHEGSRIVRLDGADPEFPYGTYGMRVFHDVPIAEPLDDAIVTAPGPLLEEVREAARKRSSEAREQARRTSCEARVHVDEEVRSAWREEAEEVTAIEDLEFDLDARPRRTGSPPTPATDATPVAGTGAGTLFFVLQSAGSGGAGRSWGGEEGRTGSGAELVDSRPIIDLCGSGCRRCDTAPNGAASCFEHEERRRASPLRPASEERPRARRTKKSVPLKEERPPQKSVPDVATPRPTAPRHASSTKNEEERPPSASLSTAPPPRPSQRRGVVLRARRTKKSVPPRASPLRASPAAAGVCGRALAGRAGFPSGSWISLRRARARPTLTTTPPPGCSGWW